MNDQSRETRLSIRYAPVFGWVLFSTFFPAGMIWLSWVSIAGVRSEDPSTYFRLLLVAFIVWISFGVLREAFVTPLVVLTLADGNFVVREYWPFGSQVTHIPVTAESRPRIREEKGSEGERVYHIEVAEPGGRMIVVAVLISLSSARNLLATMDWHIDRR